MRMRLIQILTLWSLRIFQKLNSPIWVLNALMTCGLTLGWILPSRMLLMSFLRRFWIKRFGLMIA